MIDNVKSISVYLSFSQNGKTLGGTLCVIYNPNCNNMLLFLFSQINCSDWHIQVTLPRIHDLILISRCKSWLMVYRWNICIHNPHDILCTNVKMHILFVKVPLANRCCCCLSTFDWITCHSVNTEVNMAVEMQHSLAVVNGVYHSNVSVKINKFTPKQSSHWKKIVSHSDTHLIILFSMQHNIDLVMCHLVSVNPWNRTDLCMPVEANSPAHISVASRTHNRPARLHSAQVDRCTIDEGGIWTTSSVRLSIQQEIVLTPVAYSYTQ